MRTNLRDRLQSGWLVGDGAMATLLHQMAVPARTCFEGLCLTKPELVWEVHRAYVAAGAQLIQTNTFSGHRIGLDRYGMSERLADLNRAAVRIAREAVGDADAYVIGTVGSTRDLGVRPGADPVEGAELASVFEEQMTTLLDAGVDGLLLETFADLEELLVAVAVAKRLTDVPIFANLSPDHPGVTRDGCALDDAFRQLRQAGADVVGLNCRLGLAGIVRSYERITLASDLIYSANPNAGRLHYVDGDYSFTADADYFADMMVGLASAGVRVLGGCCGTTPEHIRRLVQRLQQVDAAPVGATAGSSVVGSSVVVTADPTVRIPERRSMEEFSLLRRVEQDVSVIVELDPPKTLDVRKFLTGAAVLRDAGADVITLADNSLGTVRVSNMALASMLKERGIEPLVHVTCRDRNLIGQQSHLMGLHVLGIYHILLVTGDPSRFGDLPGATSVYDVSSIELTRMVKRLNSGISFAGLPMKVPSRFVVGTAFNPHVPRFDKAIQRLQRKLEAGADFVMTQPIYDPRLFEPIARAAESFGVPVFVGVMPLVSARNAQFLHHEVPGISIPDGVLSAMANAEPERAAVVGLDLARALLDEALQYFRGIYLITPFLRYDLTAELTRYVHLCGASPSTLSLGG